MDTTESNTPFKMPLSPNGWGEISFQATDPKALSALQNPFKLTKNSYTIGRASTALPYIFKR